MWARKPGTAACPDQAHDRIATFDVGGQLIQQGRCAGVISEAALHPHDDIMRLQGVRQRIACPNSLVTAARKTRTVPSAMAPVQSRRSERITRRCCDSNRPGPFPDPSHKGKEIFTFAPWRPFHSHSVSRSQAADGTRGRSVSTLTPVSVRRIPGVRRAWNAARAATSAPCRIP